MTIYAYENLSLQTIDESAKPKKPNPLLIYDDEGNKTGEIPAIEMKNQRPSPEHIANTKGEWVLPEPTTEQSDEVPNDTGTQTENAP